MQENMFGELMFARIRVAHAFAPRTNRIIVEEVASPSAPMHKHVLGEIVSLRLHAPHVFAAGRMQENLATYWCIGFGPGGSVYQFVSWYASHLYHKTLAEVSESGVIGTLLM